MKVPRSGLISITLGEAHEYKQSKIAAPKGLNNE